MLTNLGFDAVFIKWILTCISSISFEVLVNGGKSNQFKPSKGLRQEDLLSSHLFILGQEVLSRLLNRELSSGNICGAKASANGPALTHVMYADDTVLFSKATRYDAGILAQCLDKYYNWSGQNINRAKSGIYFLKHSRASIRRVIKHILQKKSLKKDVVYLGAPLFTTRSPSKDFKFLQEKLENKLSGLRSRCLSWAGRCTLINAVAQAIPTYTLSSFHIPIKTCEKLDSLAKRFWWKPKEKEGRYLA